MIVVGGMENDEANGRWHDISGLLPVLLQLVALP